MKSSESYTDSQAGLNAAVISSPPVTAPLNNEDLSSEGSSCFFCGNSVHPRSNCSARDAICMTCQKKGHFAKVCRGKAALKPLTQLQQPFGLQP